MSREGKIKTGFIVLVLIILVLLYWILLRPSEISHDEELNPCMQMNTEEWVEYEKGFKINLPPNWSYMEYYPLEGSKDISWFVGFGPNEMRHNIKVGLNATDYNQFKQLLGELDEKYEIKEELDASIDGKEGKKLIAGSNIGQKRDYQLYFIPYGIYNYILIGPANNDQFEDCQMSVFNYIAESFVFPQKPGQGMVE